MEIKKAKEKTIQIKQATDMGIKVKDRTIKQVASVGAKVVSEQMDGGEEIRQAAVTAHIVTKPAADVAKNSTRFLTKRQEAEQRANERQKTATRERRDRDIGTTERHRDETKKSTGEFTGKKKTSSSKEEAETGKKDKRKKGIRKLMYQARTVLLMKNKEGNANRQDTDEKEMDFLKSRVVPFLAILGCGLAFVALVSVPFFATISWLYHTPCAILCPPLEEGETVQDVAITYVNSFYQEVEQIASTHEGYDDGKVVYADYEGASTGLDNFKDIVVTYMVKYGMNEAATVMNDTTRERIQEVVSDMCSYTISTTVEEVEAEDGTITEMEVLCVNVSLKTIADMKLIYDFTEEQISFMDFLMSYNGFMQVEGGEHQSALSPSEISDILDSIPEGNAKTACEFALYRVGYPYSQDYRDSGQYYDCSSLVYYAWQAAGVNISYGGSNTAASEAQGLEVADKKVSFSELQPGDLIFWSFCNNGGYKNISHVGIYVGNGKVVEAYNESKGVIYGDVKSIGSIVTICRP